MRTVHRGERDSNLTTLVTPCYSKQAVFTSEEVNEFKPDSNSNKENKCPHFFNRRGRAISAVNRAGHTKEFKLDTEEDWVHWENEQDSKREENKLPNDSLYDDSDIKSELRDTCGE